MEGNRTNGTLPAGMSGGNVVPSLVLVVGIASVIFNGALLIAMTFNPRQVFASLGSYFIYNLAIADFITGVNSIVWAIEEFLQSFSLPARLALHTIFWITVQVSFFTIFVMSTERLVAIVFPFKAAALMSKKKTTMYCIAVWILAIVCAVIMNFAHAEAVLFFLTIVFELVIVCIVIEYVQVFRQLRVLWLNSKSRTVYNGQNNNETSHIKKKKTTDLQREYEVTIVVVTLAIILVVTVFPYMITLQVVLGYMLFDTPLPRDHPMELFVGYYFPIELLNFVVNPIVYGWRLPKYRKAFLATFGLGKKRKLNCSNGSPKTTRTTCATDNQMGLLS